ncbi:S41 family peptidase [Haliscomenobacter sp.]|uniref:S41 family peptidase n=1 Tax=Haliscomenobacter sp. TaxID=2717303 RepID=UPI003364EA12
MKLLLALTIIFLTLGLQAQTDPYLTDLSALKAILQKTPSYKSQIKGKQLALYKDLYDRLVADTSSKVNSYKYFYNLAQLIFPLKDNHLGFYQIPDFENFKDQERIEQFITTKEFLDYPQFAGNLDSLKSALTAKPAESIEGIFYYGQFYSVGLFKSGNKEYIGVVLESAVSLWQKGQVAIHLYEYAPNLFKAIYGHPLTKNFILHPVEKYQNQALLNSYFYNSYAQSIYAKQLPQVDWVNLPKNTPKFELRQVADDIQYLAVRTFQADLSNAEKSAVFLDSVKNSLTAANLILDLRNSEGGAKKMARKYVQLIREYTKKGNVFILINNGTVSQAEILTLRLKKFKNTRTLGQTTKGMLSYGSNYGKREKLPSQHFEIYVTDMKGPARLLNYEDIGIDPDIFLDEHSNWIEQAIKIIRKL